MDALLCIQPLLRRRKKKKTSPEILPVKEDGEKNVSLKIKFIYFLNDKPNQ